MSYECEFHYHERNEDGKYNTEEKKTFTKTVGKKGDDTDLDQCAKMILSQLARRDLWVVDVKVSEFAKREVSFKETKGGIIVKNRKYMLDAGDMVSEDIPEQQVIQMQPTPTFIQTMNTPGAGATSVPTLAISPKLRSPIRYEVFRPNRDDLIILQKNGTKLTLGKRYPIYEEKVKGETELFYYLTQDDSGAKIELNSLFFEPERRGLIGMPNVQHHEQNTLQYMNGSTDMPNLRGG